MESNWSYRLETPNSGQNQRFFVPWDLEIWWMTLKNNRAPLLCYFKLCASFHNHLSIQTGVTVCQNQWFFCPVWSWNLTCDLEKLCASFHSHWWIQTGVTVWKCPNWGKIWFDLCDLDHWPLTLTFCMDITFVVITPENFMMIWWEVSETDRQMEGRTDGQKCS